MMRLPKILIVTLALVAAVLFIASSGPSTSEGNEVSAAAPVTTTELTTPSTSTSTTSTTLTPATTTTAKPTTTVKRTTTTVKATTTAAPPPTAATTTEAPAPPPPPPVSTGLGAYAGVGTWVDAFDFNPGHSNGNPSVKPSSVDAMAAAGAKTIYIQAARSDDSAAPGDLMAPDLLAQFLTRAHSQGMSVVAWYLPKFADLGEEQRHLAAILNFSVDGHKFDGVGLDIEWRGSVPDVGLRNARLVELSQWLRAVAVGVPLGAIVVSPVVTDSVNTNFWSPFPWAELVPYYDIWMTMGYWTDRKTDSPYVDAYTNAIESVRLLQSHVGNVPVHPIGGIGHRSTDTDYARFAAACNEMGVVGRSIYDWATGGSKSITAIA